WERRTHSAPAALRHGARLHVFEARKGAEAVRLSGVVFDDRHLALRIVDQPDEQAGGARIEKIARELDASACLNGGFFQRDFTPLGQFVSDGRTTGAFTRSSLVSGAVLVRGGSPALVWNAEFTGAYGITQMLQAGPRLVDAGRPVGTLEKTRSARRSFIAHDGRHLWLAGTAEDCTLAALAEILVTPGLLPGFTTRRALNLDGGGSTALCARLADGGEFHIRSWRTVRNYLAIVAR
ncbi:MAG TPA: phosphodiester glycosidase family protein, partial [Prosthecobacter sp.]|nr:phosphodiester glycosidase family protein [Prosthecobacter sp.]